MWNNIKIKPLYLYGGIVIIALAFLIFFTAKSNTDVSQNTNIDEMPDE